MQKKLFTITALAVLLLSACTKEKTHTVREFLHDPELLKKTMAFCRENPGERIALPNCVNVISAYDTKGVMLSGSKWRRCFKSGSEFKGDEKDIVDHDCIDAYLAKRDKK